MKLRKNAKILGDGVVNALLVVACFLAQGAWAAIWTGGASGYMNDAANWDGSITTSTMVFTNDCTVTLSGDLEAKQLFTNGNSTDMPNNTIKSLSYHRNILVDLNGHTLSPSESLTQYWRNLGTSVTLSGGGTFSCVYGSTTNAVIADNGNHYGMGLTVTGAGTKFIGSYANKLDAPSYPGTSFRLLDGAEAEGPYFNFGGYNSTNEISGGSCLRYHASSDSGAYGLCVGGQRNSSQNGGSGDVLTISGEGTVVEPVATPTTNGYFVVGYGGNNGGNRLVVKDGATLVLPRYASVGHGGFSTSAGAFHSYSNEFVVTGAGTTLRNDRGNSDYPTAVGRRGSFNRFLLDNGAFARLTGLSCGGEVKGTLNNEACAAAYTSAWNVVTIDHASTLDAGMVLVGNQHTDSKLYVARNHAQCYSNRVEILGGSTLYSTNGATVVGSCAPYFGNVLSISGVGTTAKFANSAGYGIIIGVAGSSSNRVEVLNGAKVEVNANILISTYHSTGEWGYGPDGTTIVRGIGNELRIEGEGTTVTGLASDRGITLGSKTNGNANVIWVGDGATLTCPANLGILGFDNKVVVSNATFNLAGPVVSVSSTAAEAAGRTRFVFAGAAPKLVSSSESQSKFQNGAILRFEIPAAGWSEAPLQATGTSNNVKFNDDTKLEVDVKAFKDGEVPLVTSGKGLTISSALLESWNADLAESRASVRLSADSKTLILKKSRIGIVLFVR